MELQSATASLNRTGQTRLADRIDITGRPTTALVRLGFPTISQLVDESDVLERFSIDDLQFDTRTYNRLKALGIKNVRQVLRLQEDLLYALPGFGRTSFYNLRTVLRQFLSSETLTADLQKNSVRSSDPSPSTDSCAVHNKSATPSSNFRRTNKFGWILPGDCHDSLSAPITSLGLSVRARHVLERLNLRTLADVLSTTDIVVLHSPNCGIKTLSEIKTKLFGFLSANGDYSKSSGFEELDSSDDVKKSSIEESVVNEAGWRLPPNITVDLNTSLDHILLSPRARAVLKQLRAKTVSDVLRLHKFELFRLSNCGRRTIVELQDRMSEFLSGDSHTYFGVSSDSTVVGGGTALGFKVFVDRMLALLDERARTIVADRYGLWDGISETLQEIGDKLGCTRERIRQIEAKSLRKLGHAVPTSLEALLFQKLLRWISLSGNSVHVVAEDELAQAVADDCNQEEAHVGMCFIDDLIGLTSIFKQDLWEAEEGIYACNEEEAQRYYELVVQAREFLEDRRASSSIESVKNALLSDGRYTAIDVDRVLHVSPTFICFRDESVALSRWPAYKRPTIGALCIEALHELQRPAHFSEVAVIISNLDREGRDVNEFSVRNELARDPKTFIWTKRGTYGLAEWGLKRVPFLKAKLIELLSKSNYPLPYWHLEEEALAVCNCKRTSVRMTLDLNPKVFAKYSDNQYGLKSRK